jgi:hypothetical protein
MINEETIKRDVRAFCEEMEQTMLKHADEKGTSYLTSKIPFLIEILEGEYKEFQEARANILTDVALKELVDTANGCMMLHKRLTILKERYSND